MKRIFADSSPVLGEREKRNADAARKMAEECVVLLKNDGTLPLPKIGTVALFGMGARHTIKGGTGSGDVYSRSVTSVEQGLLEAGFDIVTGDWLDRNETYRTRKNEEYLNMVTRMAEETGVSTIAVSFENPFIEPEPLKITENDIASADAAVYVIARNSGEGADRKNVRGDYLLYEGEKADLTLLASRYEKLIVVLNIGGVMDLRELYAIDGIGAVILMAQLGNIGGSVLADVLTGKVNPSGKLTDTWARHYEDYPSSEGFSDNDGNTDDERYNEGIYVGYRYFDSFGVEPLHPFGYGLSYTEFSTRIEKAELAGGTLCVCVKVTNTGDRFAGKEVVQLYSSAPAGKLDQPDKELKAFAKTGLLLPGKSECVDLKADVRSFASYSEEQAAWILEKGDYAVLVGTSAACVECAAVITVKDEILVARYKNLFHDDCPLDELKNEHRRSMAYGNVPVLTIDPSCIISETAAYCGQRTEYTAPQDAPITAGDVLSGKNTVEELAAQLTVEEMAQLVVGTLRQEGSSALGDSSYTIPGAAGDTSAILSPRGLGPIIMADGPAGLRLKQSFRADRDGNLLPDGDGEGDTFYQYCTAIPIGWALSQSWNTALVEEIGDMIGGEMEHFGIDLWLAPALNIHRNPLCGRNFEYYSEDPLVSGLFAAAVNRGVIRHKGKSTVIKHYAANSQEDNRYFTNSHVSERALREIYLKGFEIAIKEAEPYAVMSSYNLVNGIHTANSHDLLQAVLRDEWGFKGMVMTDWFTSQDLPFFTGGKLHQYPISASTGCIYAGNDLQMPGCQKNVDDIIAAVTEGKEVDGYRITKADLQSCASNIMRVVLSTVDK